VPSLARADVELMEIQAQAALSILTMTVQGAHDALERANAQVGAGAPATAHADAILQLSTAAQALIKPSP
jgi:hypothetical protein